MSFDNNNSTRHNSLVAHGPRVAAGAPLSGVTEAAMKRSASSDPPQSYASFLQVGAMQARPRKFRKTEDGREEMSSNFVQSNNVPFMYSSVLSNAGPDQHAGRFLSSSIQDIQNRSKALMREQMASLSAASMGSNPSLFDRLSAQQQRAAILAPSNVGGVLNMLSNTHDRGLPQGGNNCVSSLSQMPPYMDRLSEIAMNNSSGLARQRLLHSLTANNRNYFPSNSANLNGYSGLAVPQMSAQTNGLDSLDEALLRNAMGGSSVAPLVLQMSQPSHLARRSSLEDQLRAHHAAMAASVTLRVCLPVTLAIPEDCGKLSEQQVFLRNQIEAFQAGEEDISTHTRGRNKPIALGQVGIRCKHCAHLSVVQKQKGSTYFPATLLGIYQAAQNMSTAHLQSGVCKSMPVNTSQKFASLSAAKVGSSGAGRPYWARAAQKLGFVDTEEGIRSTKNNLSRP